MPSKLSTQEPRTDPLRLRVFVVEAPKHFNALPREIRRGRNFDNFKTLVKTFCSERRTVYDRWLVF